MVYKKYDLINGGIILNLTDELKKKIRLAFKLPQVGDILFDDEEIKEMTKYVKDIWLCYQGKVESLYFFKEVLFVLIVQISKKWGDAEDDSYFYKKVFEKILDDSSLTIHKFQGFVDYIQSERHSGWLKDNYGSTTRYKQTFLYNAFAPVDCINGFIDVIHNAYYDNSNAESGFFDETYEESPDSYEQFVKAYADKLRSVGEKEENVSLYGGSYKLSTAFRHAFIWDTVGMAKLVSRTITYIKNFYKTDIVDDGTYYSELVKKCLSYKKNEIKKRGLSEYVEKVRSIKDWYAFYYFDLEKKKIYIKLPLLKLQSSNQYIKLYLYLLLNGHKIYAEDLNIVGNDYNPHINSICIDITNEIKKVKDSYNFSIDVYSEGNGKPIFTTQKNLFRNIILFTSNSNKENRELFVNPNKYAFIVLFAPLYVAKSIFIDKKKEFFISLSNIDNGYVIKPTPGDVLEFEKRIIYFIDSKGHSNSKIDGYCLHQLFFEHSLGEFSIYNKVKQIVISQSFDLVNAGDFIIQIANINENDVETLNSYGFTIDDNKKKEYVFDVNKYPQINDLGINRISILRADNKKKIAQVEYYVADFNLEINDEHPGDNEMVNISIKNEEGVVIEKLADIKNEEYRFNYLNGSVKVELPLLKFKFEGLKDAEFLYLSNLYEGHRAKPILAYAPDNGVGDFLSVNNSYLVIKNRYRNQIRVFINDDEINKNADKYDIGHYIISNYRNKYKIDIHIGNRIYSIYKLYRNEAIVNDTIDLEYENGVFHYSINNYVGSSDSLFSIEIYDDEGNSFESDCLAELSGKFTIEGFTDGWYHYKVNRYIYTDEFEKQEPPLLDYKDDCVEIGDVNPIRFNKRELIITKIAASGSIKEPLKIKDILFLGYDDNGDPTYQGKLNGLGWKNFKISFIPGKTTLVMYSNLNEMKHLYYDKNNKKLLIEKAEFSSKVVSVYYREKDE